MSFNNTWNLRPKSSSGGRSQRLGASFEDSIIAQAGRMNVVLNRTQPRYARIRGAWKPVGKGWVDFFGILPGGQSVNFDAKSTEDPNRWTLGKRLLEHQGEHLKRSAKQGAVTFVLVRFLNHGVSLKAREYVLPWTEDGPVFGKKHQKGAHKGKEKKSFAWEELEAWKVPVNKTWFDAAMNWEAYLKGGWKSLKELSR